MGEFFMVILLTIAVCGGVPLLIAGQLQGKITLPRLFLSLLAFLAVVLIAALRFPHYEFVGLMFVACFLRREYGKAKLSFCVVLTLCAIFLGIAIQYIVVTYGMTAHRAFEWTDILAFALISQAIMLIAFLLTPDKAVQTPSQKPKKKRK